MKKILNCSSANFLTLFIGLVALLTIITIIHLSFANRFEEYGHFAGNASALFFNPAITLNNLKNSTILHTRLEDKRGDHAENDQSQYTQTTPSENKTIPSKNHSQNEQSQYTQTIPSENHTIPSKNHYQNELSQYTQTIPNTARNYQVAHIQNAIYQNLLSKNVLDGNSSLPSRQNKIAENISVTVKAADQQAPSLQDSTRKIHVAICFFGQVKHYEHVADSVQRHILDVLRADNYTWEIFAHTYNMTTFTNPRNRENNTPIDARSLQRVLGIRDENMLYDEPDAADAFFDFEAFLARGDPWGSAQGTSLRFMLRQQYSLARVTGLWNSTSDRFHYCVYLRPDTVFRSDLDLQRLAHGLNTTTIATPAFGKYGGINDRFAFGVPSVMEKYGRRGEFLLEYTGSRRAVPYAEKYLERYLELHNLTNVDSSILFYRVRADGRVHMHPP